MRFEVRYPQGGQAHEVTLQGTVAVIGRDPACELVVTDPKCSRRHAVLEAGPQGITIRDAGSANGVFVNDRKVERSQIKEGDLVRLGDVVIKVLPEDLPGTLMMGPEDMDAMGEGPPDTVPSTEDAFPPSAPAAPPPPAAASAASLPPAPPARRPESSVPPEKPAARLTPAPAAVPRPQPRTPAIRPSRPLTVTVLAVLWLLSIPLYGSAGLALAHGLGWTGVWAALPVGLGLVLTLLSGVMGYGLWALAPWARIAQIILAAIGLLFCPFTLASAAVLVYMAWPAARAAFTRLPRGARPSETPAHDASTEGVFTAVILGTVLLGAAATGAAVFMSRRGGGSIEQARTSAREEAAVARLRSLAAAQGQFKSGTCVDAYADLDALMRPGSAIPDYPAGGPAFLPPEFARAEAKGYRFVLTVEDPVPPTEGCAVPGYRRFAYTAQPLEADGRHLLVGADGVVHAAEGRPATAADPAVR